jgi:tRNA(Ile)-lysidine synthase
MAGVTTLPVINPPSASLVRPLLAVSAHEVRDTLRTHRITWRADETNDDLARARNRVRHTVIPALEAISPGFRTALARSAHNVSALRDMLDAAMEASLTRWEATPSGWSITRTEWLSDVSPVRLGTLRVILIRTGVPPADIGSAHLMAVERFVASNRGGATRNFGQAVVSLIERRVVVAATGTE